MPSCPTSPRAGAPALAFVLSIVLVASPAAAQQATSQQATSHQAATPQAAAPKAAAPKAAAPKAAASPAPKLWQGSALANASLFFGNTQQQVFGIDGKLARVDSAFGLSAELQGIYGEASLSSGARAVTKRSWTGTFTANFRPLARVSGFITDSYQSDFEKRIAARYSLGAGAKWNVRQTAATQASLSVGLAFEHTTPLDSTVSFPESGIARASVVAKFQHSFDDRVMITHSTSWQPSASGPSQYLVNSNTALRYKMNGTVSLSATFTDNYDSGAMARGARTNNGGEMLFGVAAGW